MATLKPNTFTTYNLNEDEVEQGNLLTITQKQVIHNTRAALAEEILLLQVDPSELREFIQVSAYKRGYLDALSYLLESSEAMENFIRERDNPTPLEF